MKMRTLCGCLAAVGVVLLLTGPASAEAAKPAPAALPGSLQPLAPAAWDYAHARHLLFRAGFGGPPEEVEKLHALGMTKAVDLLVNYRSQPDLDLPLPESAQEPDPKTLAKLSPEERQKLAQQRRRNDQQYIVDVRHWWIRRMVQSPRPLEEKLVLFWHGHFATEWRTVRDARAMARQNQLFRKHAVGNFGTLLHQIIHDAAMLRYLDNNTNVKGKPNENLAREIMELFAMGESQGYTETDVIQGARALTGYTFDRNTLEPQFLPRNHDDGEKTIFGRKGNWNGEQFVDMILEQPATARFLAWKLFTYFVHEHPSEELLTQLASVLHAHNYELAPFLATLFQSQEFYSERAMGSQVKSPAQLVIGTIRTLRIKDPEPEALARAMRPMNQDLFEPPNVKGWDGGQTWVNSVTLFARHNFISALVERGLSPAPAGKQRPAARPGARTEGLPPGPVARLDFVAGFCGKPPATPAAVVDHYARALLVVPLPESRRAELIRFLGELPPASRWTEEKRAVNQKIGALLILLMCLPEYQLT